MAGYLGASPVPQTIQKKQSFTATASQTTFTTTGYTDGAFINVYLNGVRLINGTDYTATNGSDIVLTSAASASDVLDFETFNEFTLVDQTLETPTFRTSATLKNDTEEDTDGGRESTLIFKGEQSGGEISTLAEIEASHDGTADDEKGDLIFRTNDGSDGSSPTERMRIDSSGKVGIGNNDPIHQLTTTVNAASSNFLTSGDSYALSVQNADTTAGNAASIAFGHGGFNYTNFISSVRTGTGSDPKGDLVFGGRPSDGGTFEERLRITPDGLTFNGDTAAANALDDYEEGTWTPNLQFGGGQTGLTYNNRAGHYVKIGRTIIAAFNIYLSAKGSSTGYASLTGAPYSQFEAKQYHAASIIFEGGGNSITTRNNYGMIWSDARIYLRYQDTTAYAAHTDTSFTNTTLLFGTVVYTSN